MWPKNSENTVVTVVQARFQFLYPFCSGPSSSASKMRSLSIFFVTKLFFPVRWIESVLIWQASFLLYKQTSFGALYWIPLTHYFFITKKNPKDLNFIQKVVGAMDKSGTRIEIAGSQQSQRCPRISRITPVRLDSLRFNVLRHETWMSWMLF